MTAPVLSWHYHDRHYLSLGKSDACFQHHDPPFDTASRIHGFTLAHKRIPFSRFTQQSLPRIPFEPKRFAPST